METNDMPIGVTNCLRLYIFTEPNTDSEIICTVKYLTELMVDFDSSTEGFYKVYADNGAVGFCRREHITIK